MPWTHIQNANSSAISTTINLAFTNPIGSGHIIVGALAINGGIKCTSLTDDKSNTYKFTAANDDGTVSLVGFMSTGLITNGAKTLTFTFSGTASNDQVISIDEFAPPSGTTAISQDGTTVLMSLGGAFNAALTSQPFQTIQSNCLIYGFVNTPGSGPATLGAGFTSLYSGANTLVEWTTQAAPSNANAITFGGSTTDNWAVGFGVAPIAATSFDLVQNASAYLSPAGTVITVTMPRPMKPGNFWCGLAAVVGGGSTTLVSFVDNLGNNYATDNLTPNTQGHQPWWSGGLLTTAPQTFTVTITPASIMTLEINEFAPPPGATAVTVDGSPVLNYQANTSATTQTVSITTTANNELIYNWATHGANTHWIIPSGGMNALNNFGSANTDGYFIQSTAGAVNQTWAAMAGANDFVIQYAVAFKSTGGGGSLFPLFTPVLPPPLIGSGGSPSGLVVVAAGVPPSVAGITQPVFTFGDATHPPASAAFPQFTTTFPSPPIVFSNIYTGGSTPVTPPRTATTPPMGISYNTGGNWGPPIGPALPPVSPTGTRPFMVADPVITPPEIIASIRGSSSGYSPTSFHLTDENSHNDPPTRPRRGRPRRV